MPSSNPENYYYLCGACGDVTAHRRWKGIVRDQETEEMRPARDDEEWELDVCPACGYEHRDDDSDPGVWDGTIAQMDQERAVQFADLADFWIDRWKDSAQLAERRAIEAEGRMAELAAWCESEAARSTEDLRTAHAREDKLREQCRIGALDAVLARLATLADSDPPEEPTDCQNADEETDRWPVLYVESPLGGPQVKVFKHPEALLKGREHQTYHPESAPNVLSPQQTRLLLDQADPHAVITGPQMNAYEALLDRLSSYAQKEEG